MFNRTGCFVLALMMSVPLTSALAEDWSPMIQRQLDALKEEPTVQKAQAAALSFFNISPSGVQSMRTRAAYKGLMPTVDARYRRNDTNLNVDTTNTVAVGPEAFLFDNVIGSADELQVGVRFNLPLLVFNAEVLDVGSLAVLQEGVLKEITRLYYTRRRLQIDLILNPPNDPATRMSKELRIEELTSTLDAMTGNLFTRSLKRRSQATPAIP